MTQIGEARLTEINQTQQFSGQDTEARSRLLVDALSPQMPPRLQAQSEKEDPALKNANQKDDSEPISKGRELVHYMETHFNDIGKKKGHLTRDDLKEFESQDYLSDKERQYASFLQKNFNDIANLVPDSGEKEPYSDLDLNNPRTQNRQMSIDDIRALNILDNDYLHNFVAERQPSVMQTGLNFCSTSINDASLTGLGIGAVVGGFLTSPSGPGVIGGIVAGGLIGYGGGSLVGFGVCAVGAPIRSYYQSSHNRQVENWFPEKQNVVRKILSQPGF